MLKNRESNRMEEISLVTPTLDHFIAPGLILGLRPANERQRYFVTPSLIGWVQA